MRKPLDLENLKNFIITKALDQVYTEHRGLETFKELSDGVLSEVDMLWQPYENFYEASAVLELVEKSMDSFSSFLTELDELKL